MGTRINIPRLLREIKHIVKIPIYILKIPRVISKPTYFPEMQRKSRLEMWKDNFVWIIKYHELNTFYTSYGMDIKGLRNPNDYIPTARFWEYIWDGNRKEVRASYGRYNYIVLTRDKYVFSAQIAGTLGENYIPKTIALIDRGRVFLHENRKWLTFSEFCQDERKAVFKVVDGTFGDNVFVAGIKDGIIEAEGRKFTAEQMSERLGDKRYILQELIVQHASLQAFGTKCVNTIRIITIRGKSGKVSVFAAFLRVGTDTESFVDNRAKGGLAIGVELDTGKLMKYGLPHARFGEKVESHPLSGIVFEGYQLPYWKEITEMVCSAHGQFAGLQSIGWDVAIKEEGPVLLEGNDTWEIGGPQDTYGGLKKRWEELVNA